ncbi:MAG: hypothetical protein CM1200mP30_16210 [Pseudomonadota bacterium]|nr:MAG: hypothetical protein CM1200mP30_16210 [Pseudomonadota bacterium]
MYAKRFGVSDAAKEKGILAIGNVIEHSRTILVLLVASALWHMDPFPIDRAISKVKTGNFEPEDYGPYSFMVQEVRASLLMVPLNQKYLHLSNEKLLTGNRKSKMVYSGSM